MNESVTWIGAGGTAPVEATTTLSPPAGAYSAATGSIAVKLLDAAGQGVQNIAVQAAGPMTRTQSTTAEGCAFFAFYVQNWNRGALGNLTVTVSSRKSSAVGTFSANPPVIRTGYNKDYTTRA